MIGITFINLNRNHYLWREWLPACAYLQFVTACNSGSHRPIPAHFPLMYRGLVEVYVC